MPGASRSSYFVKKPTGQVQGPLLAEQVQLEIDYFQVVDNTPIAVSAKGPWKTVSDFPEFHLTFDVFLSYSRKDKAAVKAIRSYLIRHRVRAWWDNKHIRGGDQNWYSTLAKAIRATKALVVVLTPNSDNSDWVFKELTHAINLGKPIIVFKTADFIPSDRIALLLNTTNHILAFPDYSDKLSTLLDAIDAYTNAVDPTIHWSEQLYNAARAIYRVAWACLKYVGTTFSSASTAGVIIAVLLFGISGSYVYTNWDSCVAWVQELFETDPPPPPPPPPPVDPATLAEQAKERLTSLALLPDSRERQLLENPESLIPGDKATSDDSVALFISPDAISINFIRALGNGRNKASVQFQIDHRAALDAWTQADGDELERSARMREVIRNQLQNLQPSFRRGTLSVVSRRCRFYYSVAQLPLDADPLAKEYLSFVADEVLTTIQESNTGPCSGDVKFFNQSGRP
ncbi:MAG: toll/interleukin-1 receptor domain-containing protein [Planctomycetaceae bacterium]